VDKITFHDAVCEAAVWTHAIRTVPVPIAGIAEAIELLSLRWRAEGDDKRKPDQRADKKCLVRGAALMRHDPPQPMVGQ
jgi:hypothetical protein